MAIIKRDFTVEKLENKKFLIKAYIEDELSPEEVLKKLEEGTKAIVSLTQELDSLPKQVEARQKMLEEQRNFVTEEVNKFLDFEAEAKLWAKINEKVDERSSKPVGVE